MRDFRILQPCSQYLLSLTLVTSVEFVVLSFMSFSHARHTTASAGIGSTSHSPIAEFLLPMMMVYQSMTLMQRDSNFLTHLFEDFGLFSVCHSVVHANL